MVHIPNPNDVETQPVPGRSVDEREIARLNVPSKRIKSRLYSVAILEASDGSRRGTCECEAYIKWARGLACSHIRVVLEALDQIEAEGVDDPRQV